MTTTARAIWAGMLLAAAGCGGPSSSAPDTAASALLATGPTPPEATAAQALADSLAGRPTAAPADAAAARAYAQAVAEWYGSALPSGLKAHPLATGVWQHYRYVLRQVSRSRGLKKVQPQDAKTWDDFAPECAQIAALLVPLTQDSPPPTSDKAVPQLQMAWDGMLHVRLAAERHMMYLEHPYTRTL